MQMFSEKSLQKTWNHPGCEAFSIRIPIEYDNSEEEYNSSNKVTCTGNRTMIERVASAVHSMVICVEPAVGIEPTTC